MSAIKLEKFAHSEKADNNVCREIARNKQRLKGGLCHEGLETTIDCIYTKT